MDIDIAEIDWEKLEDVAKRVSARDVLIGNAEDAVVEAAVRWRAAYDAASRYALDKAIDELIALRASQ